MSFELPDLTYSFDALEPHIDAKTMQIHHDKHHQAYVNMLNGAVEAADGALDNKNLEERARNISKTLRCLVCQNQSIDESDAALAKDLRLIVRERLKLGDNDEEVINFIR